MRQREAWSKLPKVNVIKPHLRLFWEFVAERQRIWYKRFVLKQKPPWTKNKILREYKFTNVYRELDRGTIWYVENVIPPCLRNNLLEVVWLTTMYRLLNRVETFEEVELVSYKHWPVNRKDFWEQLKKRHKAGRQVFTNAHLTLPTNEKGKSKIDRYIEVLDELYDMMPDLIKQIRHVHSLERLFHILQSIPCVGRFISYEICCDLMMIGAVPYHENDWVNPGPGCKRGINLIFPKVKDVEEYQRKIEFLRIKQSHFFKKYGLKFHKYKHSMTLRGIEHSLCEFQKYYKMLHKFGKQRMYFKPHDWGQLKIKFPKG
jgi:hypothetical protein